MNHQLQDLKESLEQLQKDYDEKQEELTELQGDLEEARKDEEEQYEDMKLRIRYMYENSANDYATMLFESDSIVDFLNQAENISKITEYDREQLENYKKTKEEIETKEREVAQEKEAIAKEDAINDLLRQAKEEEAAARLAAQKAAEEAAAREAAEKAAAEKAAAEKAAAEKEAAKKEEAEKQEVQKPQKPQKPSQESNSGQSSEQNNNNSSSSEDEEQEPSIDSSQGKYLGRFKLTAYCTCSICCGKWAGGGTASGAAPTPGRTVAMGGVPFGTKLSINGTIYTVEDRGTAYGHVDILMGSHAEALQFGLKYADVYQVN